VVDAHIEEDRLAVVDEVGVARDLDAGDVTAQDRLVLERDRAREAGVLLGQRLELGLVVGEVAVGVGAGGQLGLRDLCREAAVLAAVGRVARLQIGDLDVELEAGAPQLGAVTLAVRHDLELALVAVLSEVEP
jgi:hypothetical protein